MIYEVQNQTFDAVAGASHEVVSILVHRRPDFLPGLVGIPERVLGFVAHVCEIASVSAEKEGTGGGYGAHEAGGVSGTY